ncbi:MAG: hypothetical protein ACOVO1_00575 [Chitinophagaceae bacterium]
MKNISINKMLSLLAATLIILNVGCKKRDVSELSDINYPVIGDVFIDDFTGDLAYAAFGGSDVRAFQVDSKETYNSTRQSMRFEVPDANSPNGSYAGGVFLSKGGRDLSQFNALTFYIKANQASTIGELGLGNNLGENKYVVSLSATPVTSNWKKVIIPIPDPSKLKGERGLFYFAAAPDANGRGYTFWIDEVKFEKLGTLLQGQPTINNGNNTSITSFVSVTTQISGLTSTFTLPTGVVQSLNVSKAYFNFASSNTAVASVNADGVATALSTGTTTITGSLNGVNAKGSLTINCAGNYVPAPTPTRNPANVISIFSDAYTNVGVNYYNGYWAPWQTTISNDFKVGNDNVLNYTNFNFVGMEFSNPTVNASSMSHIHLDVFFPGPIASGRQLRVLVIDFGADGVYGGGDDTRHSTTFTAPTLVTQTWIPIDIAFANMPNLARRNNLAQIILEGGDNSSLYVDNVYFWSVPTLPVVPTTAAPTPTRAAANVLSIFSDAYTNLAGTNFNPPWGQATVVTQPTIAGNNVIRYSNFNYQGVEFATGQNVSTYTNIHLDFYSTNASQLRFFLISPGPVERSTNLTVPTTAGWNSIDIPLSTFSGVNLSNVIQFKFDKNTATNSPDIFLDNMYFWR